MKGLDDLSDPDPNAYPFSIYEDFIMGYAENPIGDEFTSDGRNYVGVLNDHKLFILISDFISHNLAKYPISSVMVLSPFINFSLEPSSRSISIA